MQPREQAFSRSYHFYMRELSSLSWIWPRAAYLHIPFCAHRCGYCDFAVTAGQDHLFEPYVDALIKEISAISEPSEVDSIFIGGGTPTYLPPAILKRLLQAINCWLPLRASGEFSVEATPESVGEETIKVLADHGVNRLSLGVQSFRKDSLEQLDRIHGPQHVVPALDRVRRRIANVSLDLIFGVPGQSLADWEADLDNTISLSPEHISTYGLTYEKGTPMWKRRKKGLIVAIPEEMELDMYLASMDRLPNSGYPQYEVSNFAKPGRRCRHNEVYWANDAYFGFGVGAARFIQGKRELNCRNTADYIRRINEGPGATLQSECLTEEESARETLAIQLRRTDGISREQFLLRTGLAYDGLVKERPKVLLAENLIVDDGQRIYLTRKGYCVADAIVSNLAFG